MVRSVNRNFLFVTLAVICLTVSCGVVSLKAQTATESFPLQNATWTGTLTNWFPVTYYEYKYQTLNDSVLIDSAYFFKIAGATAWGYNVSDTFLVRNEAKKVFIKYKSHAGSTVVNVDTFEHLLYDFTLNVGDTFDVHLVSDGVDSVVHLQVTQKDSVLTAGGMRLRLTLVNPIGMWANWIEWIETVGATHHPFYDIFTQDFFFETELCLYKLTVDSSVRYEDVYCTHWSSTEKDVHRELTLSITPTVLRENSTVWIDGNLNGAKLVLTISNLQGQFVWSSEVTDTPVTLTRNNFATGIYIVRLSGANGELLATEKLVVQ